MTWNRPVPLLGDSTSAADRAAEVEGWAFPKDAREMFYDIVSARRDVRRYRPDPVEPELVRRVLAAAHMAPSVGHSQPWRFIVVSDPATRDRAARMADEQRLRQARQLEGDAARRLLDLQLEGIRDARGAARTGDVPRRRHVVVCLRHPEPLASRAGRGPGRRVGSVTPFEQ